MVLVCHLVLPAPVRMPSRSSPAAILSMLYPSLHSFQIFPVNAPDHFGLGGINDQMAFRILRIAEKPIVIDLHLPILVAKLQSQLHILAQGLAFLLGQRCHDRNQDLALGVHGVDRLFFKIDRNVLFLELADVLQAIQRIAGKPADGLGDNHVDVPGHAFVNHAVELRALFRIGAGDAIISRCQVRTK